MISDAAAARLNQLPPIRRMRGWRLYAPDGRRFLDLWQDGGRAILGHRAGRLVRDTKAVIERGCLSPFPSPEGYRARRAIAGLLSRCGIRAEAQAVGLYESADAAARALAAMGVAPAQIADPSLPDYPTDGAIASLWRPFVPDRHVLMAGCVAIVPVLPCPRFFSVYPVVFPGRAAPPAAVLPEAALRACTSSVAALVAELDGPSGTGNSARTDSSRNSLNLAGFSSVGPYIWRDRWRTLPEDEYDAIFGAFLAHGIVLCPERAEPSILPGELSDGEARLLERAAHEIGP